MSQTFSGSYITLFSQSLLKGVMQMAMTNPLALAVPSPVVAQLDQSLALNVQSLDGMLASVGISVGAGIAPPSPSPLGGFALLA